MGTKKAIINVIIAILFLCFPSNSLSVLQKTSKGQERPSFLLKTLMQQIKKFHCIYTSNAYNCAEIITTKQSNDQYLA